MSYSIKVDVDAIWHYSNAIFELGNAIDNNLYDAKNHVDKIDSKLFDQSQKLYHAWDLVRDDISDCEYVYNCNTITINNVKHERDNLDRTSESYKSNYDALNNKIAKMNNYQSQLHDLHIRLIKKAENLDKARKTVEYNRNVLKKNYEIFEKAVKECYSNLKSIEYTLKEIMKLVNAASSHLSLGEGRGQIDISDIGRVIDFARYISNKKDEMALCERQLISATNNLVENLDDQTTTYSRAVVNELINSNNQYFKFLQESVDHLAEAFRLLQNYMRLS